MLLNKCINWSKYISVHINIWLSYPR